MKFCWIVAVLALVLLRTTDVLGLSCVTCNSAMHPGCLSLDSPVGQTTCSKNEVCFKFGAVMMVAGQRGQSPREGYGSRRGCVPYFEDLGPLDQCHKFQLPEQDYPVTRCYCNDTELCNKTSSKHLSQIWLTIGMMTVVFLRNYYFI